MILKYKMLKMHTCFILLEYRIYIYLFFIFILFLFNNYLFYLFDINNINSKTDNSVLELSVISYEENSNLLLNKYENNLYSKKHSITYGGTIGKSKNNTNNSLIYGKALAYFSHGNDINGKKFDSQSIQLHFTEEAKSLFVKKNRLLSIENSKKIQLLIEKNEFTKREEVFKQSFPLQFIDLVKNSFGYSDYKKVISFCLENPQIVNEILNQLSEIDNVFMDKNHEVTKILKLLSGFNGHYGLYNIVNSDIHFSVLTHGASIPSDIRDDSIVNPGSNLVDPNEPYKFTKISNKDMNNNIKDQYISTNLKLSLYQVSLAPVNKSNYISSLTNNTVLNKVILSNQSVLEPKEILIYALKKRGIID